MDGALPQAPFIHARTMPLQWKLEGFILLAVFCPIASGTLNFSQCLVDMESCAATDQNCPQGLSSATALPYLLTSDGFANVTDLNSSLSGTIYMNISVNDCQSYCGKGEEAFSWSVFSQEFAAWLLPYLALISQLPFGSQYRIDNVMSVILTLGSPTLAGYSLYITLLNGRWLNNQLFGGINYPNAEVRQAVVQVLNRLQQVPLRVYPKEDGKFESLVVHPDNDQWWTTLSEHLDYPHAWSIASAASIGWVVLAYLLTVIDSLSNIANNINSNGQGTGSVWLWLLPIVIGWLVASPKCDYRRVQDAYNKANEQVFTGEPPVNSHDSSSTSTPLVTHNFGLAISPSPDWNTFPREITSSDESHIPPVFNYARALPWSRTVYVTTLFYREAWRKWSKARVGCKGESVNTGIAVHGGVPPEFRQGDRAQINKYCLPNDPKYSESNAVLWPPGVLFNMVVASLMSLQLQWATTGAALLVFWFTPTAGLGCRSLAFLIYGSLSTIIWAILVLSSILDNCAEYLIVTRRKLAPGSNQMLATLDIDIWILYGIADLLRWTGKFLAVMNAIGIVAISALQYSNVFDSCYCNASSISWGSSTYIITQPIESEISQARHAWLGGVGLSLSSCAFFVISIYVIRDSLPL